MVSKEKVLIEILDSLKEEKELVLLKYNEKASVLKQDISNLRELSIKSNKEVQLIEREVDLKEQAKVGMKNEIDSL